MRSRISAVALKELSAFFLSPVAFIFLGAFLFANLFTFFWVEAFFARNIADVRPLFEWMPLLMLFLVAALTMRMWSDERRMGTLEFLLTLPASIVELALGKFLACLLLVSVALLLTLPIPLTVSLFGSVDWGPVAGGYIAALFLSAAYISIGLFVSARSDNQIVSLMGTVIVCMLLYLLGSETIGSLFGNRGLEISRLLGSGSRFESITRGVLDLRDLYYYVSIVGIFLALNVYSLERLKWDAKGNSGQHRTWRNLVLLTVANFFIANIWLAPITAARADLTRDGLYSISEPTKSYLSQLQEPLILRGYFSAKTHPLLAPLVPQIRDLLEEYEVHGKGKVRAEFVDPHENPELEEEASQKYGIKPTPFQISGKYQASLVNSYFDILVQYGDKYEVLNFKDLIDVRFRGEGEIEVQLKNPEYDITRTIKKVMYGFQSLSNLFDSRKEPISLTAYLSPTEELPEVLRPAVDALKEEINELQEVGGDNFTASFVDPRAGDGSIASEIASEYGFQPMVENIFSDSSFYFYLLLKDGSLSVPVPLPVPPDKDAIRRAIETGLKRFSSGFSKVIGVYTPPYTPANPMMAQFGLGGEGKQFSMLQEQLKENHEIKSVDLKNGTVPEDVDLMLVLAPENFTEKQVFALDQFLMKGGNIILSSSPFAITRKRDSLDGAQHTSGLEEWLKHLGLQIEQQMVLDPQNEPYPVPRQRRIGAIVIPEIQMVNYPYFVDIRDEGMNSESGMVSGIQQITMNWSSPITSLTQDTGNTTFTPLLQSSAGSWTSDSISIHPNFERFPDLGFEEGQQRNSLILAGVLEGTFTSFFSGKSSPLLAQDKAGEEGAQSSEKNEKSDPLITGMIEKSVGSPRVTLFASNEFVTDQVLQISASSGTSRFVNSIQMIQNAIDWSLEDRGLLSIRSRARFSRTLAPASRGQQMLWEYLNYGFALLGLLIVYGLYRRRRAKTVERFELALHTGVPA